MGLLFVYILKSSVCLAMFYLFYRLLLSRETFHRFNRFALLGILLLSCLLPLVEVNVERQTEVQHTVMTLEQWLAQATVTGATAVDIQAQAVGITWIQVALLVYLAGILFFVFRNGYTLWRLVRLLGSGRKEQPGKYIPTSRNIRLIVHDRAIAPFSWMNYIVISRKDLDENGREILIHEMAHIRNRHSWDLLVADICIFFQWFNPAAWLLKQELQNIHEYEADETVIKEGVDAKQYQLLLIKKAVGTRLYSMANSFNHSKLKKRITMMLKEKSSPWARLKYLYVLPLAAVAVTAFARPEVSNAVEEISAVKVNDLATIAETKVAESVPQDSVVFEIVEQMPEFPGGIGACMDYIQKNMRYPEAAKKAGMQGRVTVQFIVDKEGNIKQPKVLRSVDKEFDAEAVRLIKTMPKWNPGKQRDVPVAVKFTLPVKFQLDGDSAGQAVEATAQKTGSPLYIVNGKEIDEAILNALDQSKIAHITIWKNEKAMELYGEKAKNGVMLIALKDAASDNNADKDGSLQGTVLKIQDVSVEGDFKVEGKVVDEKDQPVIGAAVLIEGTNRGTVTDLDGRFIMPASKDDVIVVSYIDMQTVKVKAAPKLTITMKTE